MGTTGQLFGGDWTENKLEILRKYLADYQKVLKKQFFQTVYIDAFAGTGYREQRKQDDNIPNLFAELEQEDFNRFLKGSAAIALETEPSFDRYIFIESDENKVNELEKLKQSHIQKQNQIQIIHGDANDFVQKYCLEENWRNTRAVLFLDPFATEVEWTTIESVAKTKSIDLWVLFPIMAVNRLLANDSEKIQYGCLNRIFGTEDWFESFYKTKQLDDIFGEPKETVDKACDFDNIKSFYKQRLKNIFTDVAEQPKVFCNSKDSPLFFFFFAVGNPKGAIPAIKIAEHLLRKI